MKPRCIILNKSYIKDVYYTANLYHSFCFFCQDKVDFYICISASEKGEFVRLFNERLNKYASSKYHISSRPIFITEEEVMERAGLNMEEFLAMHGWERQQLIKLLLWKLVDCQNYISLDSDISFHRKFYLKTFFAGGIIKTVVRGRRKPTGGELVDKYLITRHMGFFAKRSFDKKFFVNRYGLWNVSVLKNLESYIANIPEIGNFLKMIQIAPYEMEWYGKFLYLHCKEKYKRQRNIFFALKPKGSDGELLDYDKVGRKFQKTIYFVKRYSIGAYINYCTVDREMQQLYLFHDIILKKK